MPSNNLKLPLDTKPIVLSSIEAVRSEIFALLSQAGWQFGVEFPETVNELELLIRQAGGNALVIIVDNEIQRAEEWTNTALTNGIPSYRLILGVPANSIQHRILHKISSAESFLFESTKTALGPEVNVDELYGCILKVVSNNLSQIIHTEIATSRESGALSMLATATGSSETKSIERAIIASGILHSLTGKCSIHQNAVRLALFYDMIRLENWEQTVKNARRLWPIRDLFNEIFTSTTQLNVSDPWPQISLEVLAVESANIIIACEDMASEEVVKMIRYKIQRQSIEIRAAFPDAVEKINQSKKEWQHEFAS